MRRATLILGLALISLLVYLILALRYPVLGLLDVPRANAGSIFNRNVIAALVLALAGVVLHVAYSFAVLWLWQDGLNNRAAHVALWGFPIVAGLALMFTWPITSTDVFDYLFRGRLAAAYDANPYIVPPNAYKNDPMFAYVGWPNAPSAYGPLWELMSERLAAVGGTSLLRHVMLHKALALLTLLLCGLILAGMTRRDGRQRQSLAILMWLWNPLALWEIVGGGHNDGLLILSMLLALWAARSGRYHVAALALIVGTLFKFLPAILLPLVVVHAMRARETWQARLRLAAEIGLMSILLIVLAYLPYWEGPATLVNISLREQLLNASPLAVLSHLLSRWVAVDMARPIVSRMGSLLLLGGIVWQLWHIWYRGRDLRAAFFGLLAWYLIAASQWFQPWYVLWLIALLALQPALPTFIWLEIWAIFGQASYLLQYFALYWLQWRGNELPAQTTYLVLIFGPLLIAFLFLRSDHRARFTSPGGSVVIQR